MSRRSLQPASMQPSLQPAGLPKSPSLLQPIEEPFRNISSGSLPLSHYSWLLRANLLWILAFISLVMLATAFVTIRLTRIYESTAVLYVDRAAERDVVGKESEITVEQNSDDAFLSSQIKLLQSDAVVRPLAEKYNLLEREKQIKPGKDDAQKIARVRSAPIVLKGLRITRPANTYILQISYRSDDAAVATEVANGIANSYIEHIYDIRLNSSASVSKFLARQLDDFRAKMEASASRLTALEQELDVINPDQKTNILSSRLLELNSEYSKVQAQRAQAESAYNSLSVDSLEAALSSPQSGALRDIMKRLDEEKQKFADIKSRYGRNHPEYARLESTVAELEAQLRTNVQILSKASAIEFARARNQEVLLKKDVDDTKAQFDALNQRSFEYQRAKQEADADRSLYEELVKKIREGEINSGFHNDMVRLADYARPGSKPVFPSIPLNLAIAFALSSLIAVATVIIADRVDTTLRSPEQVTHGLNCHVIGALPVLKKGSIALPTLAIDAFGSSAVSEPDHLQIDGFQEGIRTIRNSILLTDFDHTLRSILMTSATPAEGKSTVSAYLAIAHAEHRRTLLIDADTRKPSLHKIFRIPNSSGLCTALERNIPWRELLVQPRPDLNLYVLPAGPATRRGADLVGLRLPQLLEDAAEEFDMVIVDAPPLLGFPEPLQLAAAADGVIVVARAGRTDRLAVAAVLESLHHLRANVLGIVLNELRKESTSAYYYYGGKYQKYYKERKDNDMPART